MKPKNPRPRRSSTINDIALACKVSTSTVSLALRGDGRVVAETSKRILAVADRLDYRPNTAARRLVMKRYAGKSPSYLVAIALPLQFYQVPFFHDVFLGVLGVLEGLGYSLITATWRAGEVNRQTQQTLISNLVRHDVDGLLVYPPITTPGLVEGLRRDSGFGQRPIVGLGALPGASSVWVDEAEVASVAIGHLFDLGHRAVLIYGHRPEEFRTRQRLAGARACAKAHGLDPDRACIPLELGASWNNPHVFDRGDGVDLQEPCHRQAGQVLLRALSDHPDISAVIGINDAVALHVWLVLEEAGIKVPDDVSVVGIDDTTPRLDHLGQNVLTSVHLPLKEIGQAGARTLVRRITGESTTDGVESLPVALMVRGSTAPPPGPKSRSPRLDRRSSTP